MPTTIDTTTQVSAPGFSNQRKIAVTSAGVLWEAHYSLADTRWEFWSSSNGGATWAESTAHRITVSTVTTIDGSFFIDQDDNAYFVWSSSFGAGSQTLRLYFGKAMAAWGSPLTVATSAINPDVVAHRTGTGWTAHVVYRSVSPASIGWAACTVTTAGALAVGQTAIGQLTFSGTPVCPAVDFAHIGDGKTAQASPHIYVSAHDTPPGKVAISRGVYSAGSWSFSATRTLDTTSPSTALRTSACFDGSRFIVAWVPSTADTTIKVAQRDAADTSTTLLTPTALSDGTVTGLSVTSDGSDIYLVAVGTTSDDPKWCKYTRASNSWGAWTAFEATTCADDSITVRAAAGYALDVIYATSATSPYTIRHERVSLNAAPNGAPWVTASGTKDINAAFVPDWDFSDPNPADTQLSYVLKRDIGGVLRYYRASDQTWQTTEQTNVTATTQVTLAAGWGADGDVAHLYYVKTTDAGGLTGPYGPALYVMPSVLVNPTLDEPDAGDTVGSSMVTFEWTVAQQIAYQARVYDDLGNTIWDSGIVPEPSIRSLHTPSILANGGSYEAGIQTYNLEGLASTEDRNAFTCSFVPPATPTITTDDSSNVYIDVTIDNPTPVGDQPEVTSLDLWVRVRFGDRPDGQRQVITPIRIATGLEPNSTYRDYAVASDTTYEYQVVAHAANGTTSTSAWSDEAMYSDIYEEEYA